MEKKINISFRKEDMEVYNFIKSQPNQSLFMRKLVEAYMSGKINKSVIQQDINKKEDNDIWGQIRIIDSCIGFK